MQKNNAQYYHISFDVSILRGLIDYK